MAHPLTAAAPPRPQPLAGERRGDAWRALATAAVALLVRLALLPLASQDTNDHTGRIWIAWRWADDPFLFLHGRWPTLHFHLIGPVVRLFDDPVLAPVLFQAAVGSLVPPILYLFAAREFRDRDAALATALAFALYPVAVRTSLEVLAQPPFSLCLALCLLALAAARGPGGGLRHAAAAGAAATLAALLRVEGWGLIPFLGLTLWPRLAPMAVFAAVAAAGPALAMAANLLHYGDPLFPLNASAEIMRGDVGGAGLSLAERAGLLVRLAANLVGGLTPLPVLLAGMGTLLCLLRRDPRSVWLVPLAGMALLFVASALRGSLLPKAIYTEPLGLLLMPFLAAFLAAPPAPLRSPAARAGARTVLLGSMALLLAVGTARDVPGVVERSRLLAAVPVLGAAPTFGGKGTIDRLLPAVRGGGGALVVDALGSPATFYLGLHGGRHPDEVYLAPGQPYIDPGAPLPEERRPLRERVQPLRDSDPPELDGFLRRRCSGVLVLQPGSRLSALIGYRTGPDRASFRGLELALEAVARAPWPLPDDARLRAPGVPAAAPGEVLVFRYAVATGCGAGA